MVDTLTQILHRRASEGPRSLAYAFLKNGHEPAGELTYGELRARALRLAGHLQRTAPDSPRRRDVERERILLLLPAGLDVPVAFFGCLAAGRIAVPAPPPETSHLRRALPRLRAIVQDCGAARAIATPAISKAIRELGDQLPPELRRLEWIDPADLPEGTEPRAEDLEIRAEDVAYLQYTSGSTKAPRGAAVSHAQLLANCRAAHEAWGYGEDSVAVNWMPYFHDYGLVEGLIQPLHAGIPCHVMSPLAFLKRPDRWLRAISELGASHSSAPNFAYEHCLRLVRDDQLEGVDLSSWRTAGIGAEVIRPETLEKFAERFAPYGFSRSTFFPSYGLAEATLLVSTKPEGEAKILSFDAEALRQNRAVAEPAGDGTRAVVSCGVALPGHSVRVVDPETRTLCEEGRVGEIWVAGPSLAGGYWRRPEASAETFEARLADGEGPFLRTGDLGCLEGGEIFITGRLKELVILAGVNHYPEDLEWSVEACHPAIRARGVVAFSMDDGEEERLVIASEIERGDWVESEIIASIRRAVAERHEVEVHDIALLRRGAVPKTSSGKVQRAAVRADFAAGLLEPVARWSRRELAESAPAPRKVDMEAVSTWLRQRLAEIAGTEPTAIELDEPFATYGLASRQALGLVVDLERWLGRELSETLFFRYPTIAAVAEHVTGGAAESRGARRATPILGGGRQQPVAVIGMSCRLPGADGVDAYWRLLSSGIDAVREIPPDRWDVDALYDPDPSAPGKMITRWGGFLDDIDHFDAGFFGISPREACHLDPRQRLILEVGWEALEDAGQTPEGLAGSDTGVFVATLTDDYGKLLFNQWGHAVDAYSGPGTAHSVVANRLSYFLDLRGPSLALDTACSGSLVALHLAAQSLERGECSMAVAGGVSVLIEPGANIFFSKAGAMAPDGRCKTFDHRADGIVRSEGIGLVVLKPLDQALEDGDPILATLLGSAVNHDGRSNGIMAPNGEAQEALLRTAYRRAGVKPSDVQYIEAHGTGTSLGDPIETTALGAVLGDGRDGDRPCAIGSVKTNVGHLEPAAGIAGVMKVILSMQKRRLPPTLHFEQANPLIPLEQLKLRVQDELGPWPAAQDPLVAGVSGFGIGGANAHVVLAEAPETGPATSAARAQIGAPETETAVHILPISARSPGALAPLCRAYAERLRSPEGPHPTDLCYSASHRRSHHGHRLAVVGATREELAEALEKRADGGFEAAGRRREPRVVWAFSGQGSHWVGMARRLAEGHPAAAQKLREVDEAFHHLAGHSLLPALNDEASLQPTEVAQPAIFAMQVALAAQWRAWGLEPTAVVGQSLGEVAAAHVAGALSLEDAVRVVYHRSRLMAKVEGQGETAVVGLELDAAAEVLAGLDVPSVDVAGSTSPATSIIAGDPEGMAEVLPVFEERGVFCRRLKGVRLAFHSPQMDPLQPELEAALEGLAPRETELPLVSSLTGGPIEGIELGAAYWGKNLRQPFRFAQAVSGLVSSGLLTFLEVSPHGVLVGALRQSLQAAERDGLTVASMGRDLEPGRSLRDAAATLYEAGCGLDWDLLHPHGSAVRLPTYPWQRERFWIDQVAQGAAPTARTVAGGGHPLLGERFDLAPPNAQSVWQLEMSAGTLHYLDEHRVHGAVVLPGTTYLEMALAAAREAAAGDGEASPADAWQVVETRFEQAMFLTDDQVRRVQLVLAGDGAGASFTVSSRVDAEGGAGPWQVHARGLVQPVDAPLAGESTGPDELAAIRERCSEHATTEEHYSRMEARGFGYGPSFRVVAEVWRREGEALGHLQLPAHLSGEASRYGMHPVVLDAGLQLVAATMTEDTHITFLPVGVDQLRIGPEIPERLWCHCVRYVSSEGQERAKARFLGADGRAIAELDGLRFQRLDNPLERVGEKDWRWQPLWEPAAAPTADETPGQGTWLVLCDAGDDSVGEALAGQLEGRGESARLVHLAAARELIEEGREDDLQAFFAEQLAACSNGHPPRGVVHLWSLDLPETAELDAGGLAHALTLGCGPIPPLVRALAGHGEEPPRLFLVTRGAQPVAGPAAEAGLAIARTPIWGLGRAVAHQEHPGMWGRLIDLDPAATNRDAARDLAIELAAHDDPEDTVGYRDGQRHAPRLRPYARARVEAPRWRVDGTYLITGGFGGLGLAVARRMVEHGARRLILLGRSALPERGQWADLPQDHPASEKVAAVLELEAMGASVHVGAVDVADRPALEAFFERFRAEAWPPIRGVVHSAGVVRDQLIEGLRHSEFEDVVTPKVFGAFHLHELLAEEPLDFFVLFSSAAALLTPPGQSAYAAGNAFLDALAHVRRASGKPGQSLNWGPWSEVGMAARLRMVDSLALSGAHALDPRGAIEIFEHCLRDEVPQLAIFSADWPKLLDRFFPPGVEPPLIAHLRHSETAQKRQSLGDGKSKELLDAFRSAEQPDRKQDLLLDYLIELASQVLRLEAARIDTQQSLNALGIDSIMAVELKTWIEESLDVSIPMVEWLQGPSLAETAVRIQSQLETGGSAAGAAEPS